MTMTDVPQTGRIFDIQRFSIHDGPGIRTTVFLQGCPLHCAWCHNPEGIGSTPVLSFMGEKCIGCGYCFKTCPNSAHKMEGGRHVLDRKLCLACGLCTRECYAKALELMGRQVSVADVMKDVLADEPFYRTSGGGMTLSGGEPLYQPHFTAALLAAAKAASVHCCVETAGLVPWSDIEPLAGMVDLFLCDVKDTNDARHRRNTGASNVTILANIRRLHDLGKAIRLRVPLVPGYNDQDDNLDGLIELARSLPRIEGVEIMPYHKLGQDKHARIGTIGSMIDNQPPDPQPRMAHWITRLTTAGVHVLNEQAKELG